MMGELALLALVLGLLLVGCGGRMGMAQEEHPGMEPGDEAMIEQMMGAGGMAGMMQRHAAELPAEYAGRTNPVAMDEEALARGAETYDRLCAACHGADGMGDGPAGAALEPRPAPVAMSSRMMADDYVFWRISEGGAAFRTAMPGWKDLLGETERWELVGFLKSLGM
jgi:mono/diheme cytochrome c family protein